MVPGRIDRGKTARSSTPLGDIHRNVVPNGGEATVPRGNPISAGSFSSAVYSVYPAVFINLPRTVHLILTSYPFHEFANWPGGSPRARQDLVLLVGRLPWPGGTRGSSGRGVRARRWSVVDFTEASLILAGLLRRDKNDDLDQTATRYNERSLVRAL